MTTTKERAFHRTDRRRYVGAPTTFQSPLATPCLAIFFLCLLGGTILGQPNDILSAQSKIIRLAQDTATTLCPKPNETSQRTVTDVTGAIKGELPELLKKINPAPGGVGARYQNTETRGVLEADLAQLIMSTNDCRLKVFMFLTDRLLGGPAPNVVPNQPILPSTPVVRVAGKEIIEVAPPPRTGPTVRVFPKANLTQRETIALAKLLPTYPVELGRSEIDPAHYADTLMVNRNKVLPSEVVAVARALSNLGITIKSVQQTPVGGRREIQIGTILDSDSGLPMFEHLTTINLAALSALKGAEFWKRAFNGGRVMCLVRIGRLRDCHMDENGWPVE